MIVDDHAVYRESVRSLLEAQGFSVVGEASDGVEAVAAVEHLRPQVVLVDIQLPGLDGFGVAEQLAGLSDSPAVVLISSHDASVYGSKLAAASVRGFLPKHAISGESLASVLA